MDEQKKRATQGARVEVGLLMRGLLLRAEKSKKGLKKVWLERESEREKGSLG